MLEFCATDELLEEVSSRFDSFVAVGIANRNDEEVNRLIHLKTPDFYQALGMLSHAKHKISLKIDSSARIDPEGLV